MICLSRKHLIFVVVATSVVATYMTISIVHHQLASLEQLPALTATTPAVEGLLQEERNQSGEFFRVERNHSIFINRVATNHSSSSAIVQRKHRIVIAGPVRNAAEHLPRLHITMTKIMKDFDVVRLLFYENDSTDNTTDILDEWKNDHYWPVVRISETNVTGIRTKKLAHAREILWQHIIEMTEPFDQVLFMDMDEVNYQLENLHECFNLPNDWSVCCVNQFTIYFDLYALRAKDWLECDVFTKGECPRMGKQKRCGLLRHLSAAEPPIAVDSCFGGAALYRYKEHFSGLQLLGHYVGEKNIRGWKKHHQLCEHISFHQALKKQKPSLQWYIQTKFLNNGPGPLVTDTWPCFQIAIQKHTEAWEMDFRNSNLTTYYKSVRQNAREEPGL